MLRLTLAYTLGAATTAILWATWKPALGYLLTRSDR